MKRSLILQILFFLVVLVVLTLLLRPRNVEAIFLSEWKGCGSCSCHNPLCMDFCSVSVFTTGCYAHCQCGFAQWSCHQDCNLCEGVECNYPCELGTVVACNDNLCEFNCGADLECDEQPNLPGVIVPGGECNNCVFASCTCTPWVNVACGVAGCPADHMYRTRTCNPPACAAEGVCFAETGWGPWVNDACGAGGCAANEMHQTRTSTPYGCLTQSQCVLDPACCVCGAWANDACGAGGCAANQMRQTRTCNPPACAAESQCVNDICTPWVNDACGAGGCAANQMRQTRSCTYDCLPESQCVNDICTPWVNVACGPAGGCVPGEMYQTRSCTYDCLPESRCVLDPACCTCGAWVSDACGAAGCAANQMRQTRTCNPPACAAESQCVNDICTPWVNDACAAAGCGPIQMHQTRDCTYNCESETRCVDDPKCGVVFINPLEAGSLPEVIAAIGDWIFIIGLALVILMDIIAGIIFITAGGDPNRIGTAKRIFFWKAIGAAVVIFSKGVSGIIRYILG